MHYARKIGEVLSMFSQGDPVVKTHFAKRDVITGMLRVLSSLPQEVLINVLGVSGISAGSSFLSDS